jgi:hypothetical protein
MARGDWWIFARGKTAPWWEREEGAESTEGLSLSAIYIYIHI